MAGLQELVGKVYPRGREYLAEPEKHRAFGWWYRAVPARVAQQARPVRLSHGILTVHTRSAAWASHLSYAQEPLLDSLRKHAPMIEVRELRFRVGRLPPMMGQPRQIPFKATPLSLVELPDGVARALSAVRDDRLRSALEHAAAMSLAPWPRRRR